MSFYLRMIRVTQGYSAYTNDNSWYEFVEHLKKKLKPLENVRLYKATPLMIQPLGKQSDYHLYGIIHE